MTGFYTSDEFRALIEAHGGSLKYMSMSGRYWPYTGWPYISYRSGYPVLVSDVDDIPLTPHNWAWAVAECNRHLLVLLLKATK